MQEMSVDSIRVSLMNYQRVVILKEKQTDRYLPIWVGPAEADAIAIKLQDVSIPRPLTHDLLSNLIGAFGGTLRHIVVSDLQNDTFYAKIILDIDERSLEVDCRPSDAIALAVRTKSPIFVEDPVLDKAGITMDQEGKPLFEEKSTKEGNVPTGVREEELRSLSAFRDFIEELNIEDLDAGKGAS